MSGANDLMRDVDIDIAGLLRELRRKWWLLIALPAIIGAILFAILSAMEPSYRSSARLIIEKRESVFTRRSDGDQTLSGNQFDEQAVGSQVEVLTSADLALKVITKLKLASHKEFNKDKPSIISDLLALLGAGDGEAIEVSPEERTLKAFRERLQVYAVEKSRVIAIEFWAHDPKLAQEVPNAMADEFLALTKASQLESTELATGWLAPEIDELRTKVRDAEAKVADFRSKSDILVGNNNALLSTQQLSEVSSELSRVKADRSAAEAKISAIRTALDQGGSLDVIPEVISSSLIQRLREREASLKAQISELSTTLLPSHPRLKALKSQAGDFETQIRTAARNILTSLENNVDLQRQQEAVLINEVNRLKAEAARVGDAEVELRALEREANAQRELLESYLTQYREAASRQNRDYLPVDARIISRAVMPAESFFPKVVPFTLAGAVASLVLTIVGILAAALLSGKAFRETGRLAQAMPERIELEMPELDVAEPASAKVAAPAGKATKVRNLPAVDAPALVPDPAFNGMASLDEQDLEDAAMVPSAANDPEIFAAREAAVAISALGRGVIAVVSPGGDAGSRLTVDLVRAVAGSDRSLVVIDITGSGQPSQLMLGDVNLEGLRDFLAGSVSLADTIYQDTGSSAHVIGVGMGREPGNGAMARLKSAIGILSQSYDFVVLDCGYVAASALEGIVGPQTIIVIATPGASNAELVETEQELRMTGFDEIVCVKPGAKAGGALRVA